MNKRKRQPPTMGKFSPEEVAARDTWLTACDREFSRTRAAMCDPSATRAYLRAELSGYDRERFVAVLLDNQHRVIAVETLAEGTINAAAVYPREVVKSALAHSASAVIFAHNHPSGINEPSSADRHLTDRLKSALALVDVRVLDHFVVGSGAPTSFAERGWI